MNPGGGYHGPYARAMSRANRAPVPGLRVRSLSPTAALFLVALGLMTLTALVLAVAGGLSDAVGMSAVILLLPLLPGIPIVGFSHSSMTGHGTHVLQQSANAWTLIDGVLAGQIPPPDVATAEMLLPWAQLDTKGQPWGRLLGELHARAGTRPHWLVASPQMPVAEAYALFATRVDQLSSSG